ncbi:MAG: Lrp/AsnC ligand binding domain-containing protein [Candidatus Nezhaarchaeales archaeon]
MAFYLYEAYVLLRISREVFARGVVNQLREVPGVEEAELLFGDYDAIIKVKANKIHEIENLVVDKVASIKGIVSTMTMLCVDDKILEQER